MCNTWGNRLSDRPLWGAVVFCLVSTGVIVADSAESTQTTPYLTLDTLVVIYRSTVGGSFSSSEVDQIKDIVARGREFYWRNSRATLNLNISFLEVLTTKVAGDFDALGLRRDVVGQDLKTRGIIADQYDAVFSYAKTPPGSGGYFCFGPAIGLGQTMYSAVSGLPDGFVFIHELHHAIESMANSSGFDYLDVHPNFFGVYGGDEDVNAYILRTWPRALWFQLRAPWGTVVQAVDADQDGLPDADARVMMDEARFASDPTKADTDGDELTDLEEYAASNETSANPLNRDTDGDGLMDGHDQYPLWPVETWVKRYIPILDGTLESNCQMFYDDTRAIVKLGRGLKAYLTWDDMALYLAVSTPTPQRWTVRLDANGDGFLRGPNDPATGNPNEVPDNYDIVVDAAARQILEAHVRNPETRIWRDGVEWNETIVRESDLTVRFNSTGTVTELRIPRNAASGLLPANGKHMGIAFIYGDGQWVFDTQNFIMVRLTNVLPADGAIPSRVRLGVPSDNASVDMDQLTTFQWSPSTDAGGAGLAGYFFELDDQLTFESPLMHQQASDTRFDVTIPRTLETRLFWRVQPRDAVGNDGLVSPTNTLAIVPSHPQQGSIHLRIKHVDANGALISWLNGATVRLTDPTGQQIYQTQFSAPNCACAGPSCGDCGDGWVWFDGVAPGTYGLLAYKVAYQGQWKQADCATNGTLVNSTLQNANTGGLLAAWDNEAPVIDNVITWCQDLGLGLASVNAPPVLSPISPQTIAEGQLLRFTASASDSNGDVLTYTIGPLPAGASFNTSTKTFTWTPAFFQAGSYPVTMRVTDPGDLSASQAVTITVMDVPASLMSLSGNPNPFSPNGDRRLDAAVIRGSFNHNIDWRLSIKNALGLLMRSTQGIGASVTWSWDGKKNDGTRIPDGRYTYILSGTDVGGSAVSRGGSLIVDTRAPTPSALSATPSPFQPSAGQVTTIQFTLSEPAYVTMRIYNDTGVLVHSPLVISLRRAGSNAVLWNGRTSTGSLATPGTYTYRIFAWDRASNRAIPYPITGTVAVR